MLITMRGVLPQPEFDLPSSLSCEKDITNKNIAGSDWDITRVISRYGKPNDPNHGFTATQTPITVQPS